MKKLAVVLSVLVVIAAIAFLAIHRRTVKRHRSNEARGALVKPFSFAEQELLARTACGSGMLLAKGNGKYTCSVCPPNSDFGETPAAGSTAGWDFAGTIAGSFTAAEQDEVLLHANGCESHARNNGGDFLLRRSAGKWSAVRYAPGGVADSDCQLVGIAEERDGLVCKTADMHQGVGSEAILLLQFDATGPPQSNGAGAAPFLLLTDDSSNCGFEASLDAKPHPIQLAKVDGYEVLPENAEGHQDVLIQLSVSRVDSPSKQGGTCPVSQPKRFRLTYHNIGDHFEAAEGYVALHALHRDDCCLLEVQPRVVPTRF